MVSRLTKHKVADLLEAIAEGEIKAEIQRLVLAEKYSFEPYSAFKRIALAPRSYITSTDLHEFLLENKVTVTSGECRDLLNAFDADKDGSLSYNEFLNIVLPRTDPVLRKRVTLRETYPLRDDERLPYDIEYALTRLLEEELNAIQRTESLKGGIHASADYTAGRVFNTIDYDAKNYLIFEDFADFSDDIGRGLSEKQIDALIRRLDSNQDGRITYSEFIAALSYPKTESVTLSSPRHSHSRLSPRHSHSRLSPRHSRQRSSEIRETEVAPLKTGLKDLDYSRYLSESRSRRSASPRRRTNDIYETPKSPRRSVERLADTSVHSHRKRSPLRNYEEEELARSFKDMIISSRHLESCKNELVLRFDFNLFDAYRYFDVYGTGAYISSKQFEEGLAELKIFPTKDQISLFFKHFDSDYDGFLRFTDFSNLITPKSDEYARILDTRKPRYVDDSEPIFTRETERLFAKVLSLALENEVQAEAVRQRLSRLPLFNLSDAFRAVDKYDQGYILIDDLKEILGEHGMFTTSKDADLLVERFKGNDHTNGKIYYSEFVKELSPKSFRKY
eukprot:CAMPEP_0176412876 /NCGR_PEP_ID=MMETSP0127-20121128/4383_1 /TAXON_ID=938130 /ORGANISM="Platyophrya macrostoma, Strain WH" /LENGTH=561 /DNA_ID=CAMNT_0017792587 /DNA_START=46 /DNA_END=1731 /DNA_ORIENTATION=+